MQLMGRLKRIRDRDTGAIHGYIFDGVQYDAQQFNARLREMLSRGDTWAQEVVANLDDFRVLRASSGASTDPDLMEAELRDIDYKMTDPKTTEVEKVHLQRRIDVLKSGDLSHVRGDPRARAAQTAIAQSRSDQRLATQHRGVLLHLKRALGREPTQQEINQFLHFLGAPSATPRPIPAPAAPSSAPAFPGPRAPEPPRNLLESRIVLAQVLGRQPTDGELRDIKSVRLDFERGKTLDEGLFLRMAQLGHPAARLEMRRRGLVMPGTLAESLVKNPITRTIAGIPTGFMSSLTAGALQPKIARVAGEKEEPKLTRAGKVLGAPAHLAGFVVGPYKVIRPLATPITQAIVRRVGTRVSSAVLPYIAALSQRIGEGAAYGVLETMARDFDLVLEIQRKRGTGAAIDFVAKRSKEMALSFGISLAAMHGIFDMIRLARLSKQALKDLAGAVREGGK